jgi:hypothetical protein
MTNGYNNNMPIGRAPKLESVGVISGSAVYLENLGQIFVTGGI